MRNRRRKKTGRPGSQARTIIVPNKKVVQAITSTCRSFERMTSTLKGFGALGSLWHHSQQMIHALDRISKMIAWERFHERVSVETRRPTILFWFEFTFEFMYVRECMHHNILTHTCVCAIANICACTHVCVYVYRYYTYICIYEGMYDLLRERRRG